MNGLVKMLDIAGETIAGLEAMNRDLQQRLQAVTAENERLRAGQSGD